MNGDILSLLNFKNLYDFACNQESILTITIKKIITPYAFGNIFFDGNLVTGIEEKPDIINYALSGIYVMKPEVFNFIPQNKYFGMDSLIKILIGNKLPVSKYEIKDYWLDIGRIEDYQKAQEVYETHFKSK